MCIVALLLIVQERGAVAVTVCATFNENTATVCSSGPPTTCTPTFYVIEVCVDSSYPGGENPPVVPVHFPNFINAQENPADQNDKRLPSLMEA